MDHATVARRRDADAPAVTAALPGRYGVFSDLVTVRHFAGLSAAVPPLRRRGGRSLSWPPSCASSQPCCRVHDCPSNAAVPLPEFYTSLTPHSLGSGYHFFVAPFHRDSRPSASWESRALPAAAPRGHLLGELLGEPLRYLPLYQAPPPLAYSFAPPRRDELITSLPPGLVKLLRSSPHLVFT